MSGTSVIILELFSGIGSVAALGSRVLQCNPVTLDVDPDRGPSICTYIAEVSDTAIQSLKSVIPAVEWFVASPPCDQYSRAHTCGTRDSERADVLAKRMWKFIDIRSPNESSLSILHHPCCGSVTSCWREQGPRLSWTIASTGQRTGSRPCFGATGRCRDPQQRRARALGNVQRLHHPHVATS